MGTQVRIALRLGVAIAGVALVVAGVAVVEASGGQVHTSSASGYYSPPTAYNVGDSATFSYTVTNLTDTTIGATLEFDTARITSFEGIDVSTGYPALRENEIGQNWQQTVQIFDIPKQYQANFLLTPMGSQTVTFTTAPLTECGYYQLDSEAVDNSVNGLFATGFIRVIGCTSPPTGTPTPSLTPTPAGLVLPTATPSGSASGSPTPSASEQVVTASPAGAVLAASTPGTGVGPAAEAAGGIAVIVLGILLVIGALIVRRRRVEVI
jgi:hypothetical protein